MNTAGPSLRAVVVDDEPPARALISAALRAEGDVEVLAECSNGREAVLAIEKHEPDVVFLDVNMPGLDGFGVLAEARPRRRPHVVFVTAYDHHAIRAFEVQAIDYLVKPVDPDRMRLSVQRAREHVARMAHDGWIENRRSPDESARTAASVWDRIAVRSANRVVFVKPDEVDWIEAEGNYVRLHVGKRTHLLRDTMQALERRLGDHGFVRISRAVLVNLDRVSEWHPLFHGDSVLVLHDGSRLPATRAYRAKLDCILGRLE